MWVVEVRDDSADRLKAVLEGEADVTVTPLGVAALDDHIDPVQLFARGIVTMGAQTIVFTRREAQVIVHLAAHRSRVVSRAELLQRFWGRDTRSLDVEL